MNTKESHRATKAQAIAVREYLASIGIAVSHVQALEVIARGRGERSRHLLATKASAAAAPSSLAEEFVQDALFTRVAYSYVDGGNCKRSSSIIFRGALRPEQLELIASKLDEGKYFVPAQVGFESLHLAFTDDGGDDHWWHAIELAPRDEWVLDDEGYVMDAGAVVQVQGDTAWGFATDADCDNLMWRFGTLERWTPTLQEMAVRSNRWAPKVAYPDEEARQSAARSLREAWLMQTPAFRDLPQELLKKIAQALVYNDFTRIAGHEEYLRKDVAPNAYQLVNVLVGFQSKEVELRVTTKTGEGETLAGPSGLVLRCEDRPWDALTRLGSVLADQLQAMRTEPAAYQRRQG